jgi:hypothetical protein
MLRIVANINFITINYSELIRFMEMYMDLNLVSNTNIMDTTWSCEFCEKPGPTAEKALLE